jgi:polyisoprenoid-binding protein YceI
VSVSSLGKPVLLAQRRVLELIGPARYGVIAAGLVLAACGIGDAALSVGQRGQATPGTPTAAGVGVVSNAVTGLPPAVTPPAGALIFTVTPEQSRATFRVREQLVGVQVPGDAVGSTGAVTGRIVLRRDGGLAPDASKITVDLRELKSDDPRRDSFIKQSALQTNQFPYAEFMPRSAPGIPSPPPASGEHAFRMTGVLLVHGVQREVTWDVTARRDGTQLTGRAVTAVKFGDFGMTPPRADPVVSVVDEIRLELNLVAVQA